MQKLSLWARFMLLLISFAINFLKWAQNPRRVVAFIWYMAATTVCLWLIGAPFGLALVLGAVFGAFLDYIIHRAPGPK